RARCTRRLERSSSRAHGGESLIEEHGWAAFGKWHLAEDDEIAVHNRSRYKFPYGDFKDVHRCAGLSAESRAGQYTYVEIELAAAHLHGMLGELMPEPDAKERRHVSTS